MSIRKRIAYGYTLVVGIAVVGVGAGLGIGNYYQQQALVSRDEAVARRHLINELQVQILYNRPAKQLSPHLGNAAAFDREASALSDRVTTIQTLLADWSAPQGADEAALAELDNRLAGYGTVLAQFEAQVQELRTAVAQLDPDAAGLAQGEQLILNLVQSPEFEQFIDFPQQLAPFYDQIDSQATAAEATLAQAETLRTWLVLGSLFLSGAIAVVIALYTSRAIARPLQTVTDVARQVSEANDFTLQVPNSTHAADDEVGVLTRALNQLLRQVQTLLSELGQKNTDLEAALHQVNRQQVQLVQAEKMSSLGQLVAGVAHEINNPVNFIHGNLTHVQEYTAELLAFVQALQTRYPEATAMVLEAAADTDTDFDLEFIQDDLGKVLDSMQLGTQRIRQIVLSLRNFSRLDEAAYKAVDLHEGIDSSLMILQHRLKAKPDRPAIDVVKNYGTLPPVECFPGQLNQVYMNLLVNAIDALEERATQTAPEAQEALPWQITLRTSIIPAPTAVTPATSPASDWVEVVIADSGAGMSEQVQQRLFEPFFTTKPVGVGTGMGLSISYQIIAERHQGYLTCRSTPGQGTEFILQIPCRQAPTQETPGDQSDQAMAIAATHHP